ncbi:MAG: polysaccharide biosynthesis tyrosine autokinase [Candidatus Limnocylindrales bacterium]
MELRRQFAIVRSWLPLLVALPLLAGAAAYVVSSHLPKVYEAKATLNVGQSLSAVNPDYTQVLVSQDLSATYATVATTRPVLDAAIAQLGLDMTSDDLLSHVHADAQTASTLLTITADDAVPTRAAAIANAMATQLIAASPAIQGRQAAFQASIDADLQATQGQITATQAKVDSLTALTARTPAQDANLATLEGQLVTLRSTYSTLLTFSSSNVSNLLSVVEPAVVPLTPVSPRPLLNTLLAAVLGLLVAAGVVVISSSVNDAIRDVDEVQEAAGLSTLGEIAQMRGDRARSEIYRLAVLLHPRSAVAEAYRALRTNIEFSSVDAPISTLLVTSATPGEGKTVTACNLAVVFAQAGRRVVLVDADLRKPGVHQVFDLPNASGLTTLLRDDHVSVDTIAQVTEQDNLRVITTGPLPPNPAELLGSRRMRAVLERLKAEGDLLILDSPPLQAVADGAVLSSFLDGTLLVIDARRSRGRTVRAACETLTRAGATVVGAVLNRMPDKATSSNYYAYYGDPRGTVADPDKRVRGAEEPRG